MRLRGRVSLVGAVSGAVALGLVPGALAAKSGMDHFPKGSTVVRCTNSITTEIPQGSVQTVPSPPTGQQWGQIHCKPPIGIGIEKAAFSTDVNSGNLTGKFKVYFSTGTVTGKFMLLPAEGSLVGFAAANYAGNVKIVSGTGTLTGAKGVGTATCTSADGLHFSCLYKLALTAL